MLGTARSLGSLLTMGFNRDNGMGMGIGKLGRDNGGGIAVTWSWEVGGSV